MTQDNKILWIIGIIIFGIIIYNNPGAFTIYNLSPQVQYNNQPIEARFTLANFTNPSIKALFNGQQVYTAEDFISSNITEEVTVINSTDNSTYKINQTHEVKTYPATNQKYVYTSETSNGTYILKLIGVNETGTFKFIVSEGNKTEIQTIEVKNPYVNLQTDLESVLDEGTIDKITIKTLTPQGADLEIESLDIQITKPDSTIETLTPTKSGSIFTTTYTFSEQGNYIFKIKGRKIGYDSKEFTVAVSVTKNSSIPLIIWIWISAVSLFIILVIVRMVRR